MSERPDSQKLREFILTMVNSHARDIIGVTAQAFGVTHQAVGRHVRKLVAEGALVAEGKTRSRVYRRGEIELLKVQLRNISDLEEDVVWKELLKPEIQGRVVREALNILEYGFTELFNNVIDHSLCETVDVSMRAIGHEIAIEIRDNGVGIFRKIRESFHLPDDVAAVWELVKGKLTTDPKRHSGEGLFFTSRMFDRFELASGSLRLVRSDPENDWSLQDLANGLTGTTALMVLARNSTRNCKEVFDRFADPERDDYSFARTHFPVRLLQYGNENLVSRSQAKRVIQRFERFCEVVLDFEGVESIGQGFADEVFRVFKNEHPAVTLTVVRAGAAVARMIQHVSAGSS